MTTVGDTLSHTASSIHSDTGSSEHDDGLSAFAGVRARLFSIAYSMLRRAAEAEDIVQDVWLRWQATDRGLVDNPCAFLAKTTTRLCLNFVQSAPSRRETCIESSLSELVDTKSDPTLSAERGEALKLGVAVLLEKLSPAERAAYVLREAFDYSYRQIANILQMEEVNSRQLVSRARKHITECRHHPANPAEQQHLLEAFITAAQRGDMAPLEDLFIEDVVSYSISDVMVCAA